MAGTEHILLPELSGPAITVIIGGRLQEVRPLSFIATLPAPFAAEVYAWGYQVRPAVLGPGCFSVSPEAPTGDWTLGCGGQLTLSPILRQYITVDEGMYRTPPRECPMQEQDTAVGRATPGRVRTIAQPTVRLASPIPGAPAGGVTPEVARQVVLAEVERRAGLPQPVLVNNTRWDGLEGRGSAPTEIWESYNLMVASQFIHFVEVRFVGRHGLDAEAFRTLHGSLFPGARYPGAIDDTDMVAASRAATSVEIHVSGPAPARRVDRSYVLSSGGPFGDAGGTLAGFRARPASGDAGQVDDLLAGDAALPVSLSGLDPAEGPAYVWHCHIVSRQESGSMYPSVAGR